MIDKKKLLQWIEVKRYVYTIDAYDHVADESEEEVSEFIGRVKMLSMLEMAVSAGDLDEVEEGG